MNRREFLGGAVAAGAALAEPDATVVIDPKPLFEISPWLYMQFMEPLGVTDGSVEASWDYDRDDWRSDLVAVTRDLAPGMVRWGGNYSRFYKWREGVGPVGSRARMRNYDWGGWETNRVGTHEFVDFCRRVRAEPMYCVNFLGDGHARFRSTREGDRTGDAREAADWVSYCNDPSDKARLAHGVREPYNVRVWQIGNETSYGREGFPRGEAVRHTVEFARAMRERDRSVKLIGWGDSGWAADMIEGAGEHLDMIAIHLMGQSPRRPDTVLRGNRYQFAREQAWAELLELADALEKRVAAVEEVLAARKFPGGLAVTEGHLSLRPHNANPILTEWLSAVYHARSMNTYQRRGARVKIATLADFCGTRWTVNAVLMQVPGGVSYLTPAGSVMRLFQLHNGTHGVEVKRNAAGLDVAASRAGNRIWLHVANTSMTTAAEASFAVAGMRLVGGRVFEIAPADVRTAVSGEEPQVFQPVERPLGVGARHRFGPAAVAAVELQVASEA